MVIAGYAALASPVQAQQVTIDRLPRCAPLKKPDLPLTFDAAGASFPRSLLINRLRPLFWELLS